jgi:tRNA A37 threonylcarbamoyladenosine biosynthesis protein TsaE
MKYKDKYRKEQPFSSITKLQDIHYNALSNDEDDRVLLVTGDTGAGKSNFVK